VVLPERSPSGEQRWRYDPANGSVTFVGINVPEPGAEISFRYQTLCE
jgi:hypothetical protein